jgi:hypothetical protein
MSPQRSGPSDDPPRLGLLTVTGDAHDAVHTLETTQGTLILWRNASCLKNVSSDYGTTTLLKTGFTERSRKM